MEQRLWAVAGPTHVQPREYGVNSLWRFAQ